MEYTTDKNALEDARRLVDEAVAILMRAITPAGCPGIRHQIAIREVASVLSDQAECYGMDADLTAALWMVAIGMEAHLPDDLRSYYEARRDPVHHVEGPEEAQ